MKRKIYFNITILSTLVTLLVTMFLLLTFYNFHVKSEIKSLRDYGKVMANLIEPLDDKMILTLKKSIDPNIRLTIINQDGDVLFDNVADSQTMENHIDRIEVENAIIYGEGEAIRNSPTLNQDTYYFAILLPNNTILRISRQVTNVFYHFLNILPLVFFIVFLILFLSFYTSSILTKKILEPVENVIENLDSLLYHRDLEDIAIYDEIMPFINKVKSQEKEIKYSITKLEEKAALMDVINSSMEEGLILLDDNKKILSVNQSAIKLLQADDKYSYYGNDFLKLSRNLKLHNILNQSICTNSREELLLNQGEKYLNFIINPALVNSQLVGLVIFVVDATQKYRIDQMRREFSANVSHELKTPLTSINGYAEMIENGMAKDEDIKKFAATIRDEGSRLLKLISTIIKLSKIEEDKVHSDLNPIDLYLIGANTIDRLTYIATEKNINLHLDGESTFIKGNNDMMAELFYNLLENGIKYTPSGGSVTLEIKSHEGWANITVTDTGIGIPDSEQSRVFERFYTVDKGRSRKTQSTGLGLSIAMHIVEYHQGQITLMSEIGKGTKIFVKIRETN